MAAKMRGGVINVMVLAILVCFLITIFQAASVESNEKKPDKAVENSKVVEGAGTAPWDKVKSWASQASEKFPKSFSFKKTPTASQDSHGSGETVKEAAKKTGEKVKQTAGKANGEL